MPHCCVGASLQGLAALGAVTVVTVDLGHDFFYRNLHQGVDGAYSDHYIGYQTLRRPLLLDNLGTTRELPGVVCVEGIEGLAPCE